MERFGVAYALLAYVTWQCTGCASEPDSTKPPASSHEAPTSAASAGAGEPSAGSQATPAASGSAAPRADSGLAGTSSPAPTPGNPVTRPARSDDTADAGAGPEIATGRKSPPDPNLTFDWEETAPGAPTQCEPGRYVGSFMCDLTLAADGSVIPVNGPVQLTLERSMNGEFLEIADARIEGFALLFFNFTAALVGRLDCSTRMLTAVASEGSVGLGDAMALPVAGFEGQLDGTLDPAGEVLSGQWSFPVIAQGDLFGTCTGPWTAMRMAP